MPIALRYSPAIETPAADEQEAIDGIVKGMTQQSETVEKRTMPCAPLTPRAPPASPAR